MDPKQFNQYAYVGGSPFHRIDPSGLDYYDCIDGKLWKFAENEQGDAVGIQIFINGQAVACSIVSGGSGGEGGSSGGTGPASSSGNGTNPGSDSGGAPPQTQNKTPCSKTGLNLGITGQLAGLIGPLIIGGAAQASTSLGFYAPGFFAPASTAWSVNGGAAFSSLPTDFARVAQGYGPNIIQGAAAGSSAGIFFGNASNSYQNDGWSRTTSIGAGVLNFSYTKNGNIWSITATVGKPSVPYVTSYNTYNKTLVSAGGDCK